MSIKRTLGLSFIALLLCGVVISLKHSSKNSPVPVAAPAVVKQAVLAAPAAAPTHLTPVVYTQNKAFADRMMGGQWQKESRPELRAFSQWAGSYTAATSASERTSLLSKGLALAQQRRDAFKQLIKDDPQAALASAVPAAVRQSLPAEVEALLEKRVSGRGDLYTLASSPAAGQPAGRASYQEAKVNGDYYDAHTYGDRLNRQNEYRTNIGIHGVAVDKDLAVLDSGVRVLDAGEVIPQGKEIDPICGTSGIKSPVGADRSVNKDLSDPSAPVATDDGAKVTVVCRAGHVMSSTTEAQWQVLASGGSGSAPLPGSSDLSKPSTNATYGVQTNLVIRVDMSDMPGAVNQFTPDVCVYAFMRPSGVNDWYLRNSHGLTAMPLSITNATSDELLYGGGGGCRAIGHRCARAGGGGRLYCDQLPACLHPSSQCL